MFEKLFADVGTIARHRDGPLLDERHRYLLHCASVGATLQAQHNRARAMLRLAMSLPADVHGQVDAELLRHLISTHQPPVADQTAVGLLNIGRPWLKFIGWRHQPEQPTVFPEALERFVV